MKKFLIIAAAAGTVLASCAKTETVEVSDAKYIGFDSAWIGNPTKIIDEVTTDNIKSFFVYGGYTADDDVFENGREVTPNANGEWTYSPLVKWEDNQTYNVGRQPDLQFLRIFRRFRHSCVFILGWSDFLRCHS